VCVCVCVLDEDQCWNV